LDQTLINHDHDINQNQSHDDDAVTSDDMDKTKSHSVTRIAAALSPDQVLDSKGLSQLVGVDGESRESAEGQQKTRLTPPLRKYSASKVSPSNKDSMNLTLDP